MSAIARWAFAAALAALSTMLVRGTLAAFGSDGPLSSAVLLSLAGHDALVQWALAPWLLIASMARAPGKPRPQHALRIGIAVTAAACIAVGAFVARELTAGAWVSEQAWVWPLRLAIASGPVLAFVCLRR